MAKICVNTDNPSPKGGLFKAAKVGKSADAAEKTMHEVVDASAGKAGLTTDAASSGKGYSIQIEATKVESADMAKR